MSSDNLKRYVVAVPIYGTADVFVMAKDEGDAIEKADQGEWCDPPEVQSWEVSISACRGNWCGRTEHDSPQAFLDE